MSSHISVYLFANCRDIPDTDAKAQQDNLLHLRTAFRVSVINDSKMVCFYVKMLQFGAQTPPKIGRTDKLTS